VIMITSPGSMTPQAMSLRVHFDSEATIGEMAVRREGPAKDAGVSFEISRRSGNDLSYLVSYDPRGGGLVLGQSHSATVAEIEIGAAEERITIAIDPLVTMLSDQSGTMKATVANGKLEVSGTIISGIPSTRPHAPGNETN